MRKIEQLKKVLKRATELGSKTSNTWESLDIIFINNFVSFAVKLMCSGAFKFVKKYGILFFKLTNLNNFFYFFR